ELRHLRGRAAPARPARLRFCRRGGSARDHAPGRLGVRHRHRRRGHAGVEQPRGGGGADGARPAGARRLARPRRAPAVQGRARAGARPRLAPARPPASALAGLAGGWGPGGGPGAHRALGRAGSRAGLRHALPAGAVLDPPRRLLRGHRGRPAPQRGVPLPGRGRAGTPGFPGGRGPGAPPMTGDRALRSAAFFGVVVTLAACAIDPAVYLPYLTPKRYAVLLASAGGLLLWAVRAQKAPDGRLRLTAIDATLAASILWGVISIRYGPATQPGTWIWLPLAAFLLTLAVRQLFNPPAR